MKTLFRRWTTRVVGFSLLSLAAPLAAFAAPAPVVESTLTHVDVYPQGAVLTRSLTVNLEAGLNTFRLVGLPTQVQGDTLQVKVTRGGDIRLRDARFALDVGKDDPAALRELEAALRAARREREEVQASVERARSQEQFARQLADSLARGFGDTGEGEARSLEEAQEVWAWSAEMRADATAQVLAREEELVALGERIKDLERDVEEARQKAQRLRGEATITVEAAATGEADLEVATFVHGASWRPRYDLRVDTGARTLEATYRAAVRQQTGEDWNDLPLTLHSARPAFGANVPELSPLYLNRAPDRPEMVRRTYAEEALMSAPAVADKAGGDAYEMQEARVTRGLTAFRVALPTPATVPTDEDAVTLPVVKATLSSAFHTEIVPALVEKGYLVAVTTNDFELPLLPGPAQVFMDGTLAARVGLEATLPGAELTLSLGVDENVVVERLPEIKREEQTGLIDKTTTERRTYRTEVTNRHPSAHRLLVIDRFPLSQNEQITVRRDEPSGRDAEIEDDTGLITWEFTLDAGASRTLTTAYSVVYPREWQLDRDF